MLTVIHIMLNNLAARVRNDDRGEVSLEYALVGGLMAVAIVTGIGGLTGSLGTWFDGIGTNITSHLP